MGRRVKPGDDSEEGLAEALDSTNEKRRRIGGLTTPLIGI